MLHALTHTACTHTAHLDISLPSFTPVHTPRKKRFLGALCAHTAQPLPCAPHCKTLSSSCTAELCAHLALQSFVLILCLVCSSFALCAALQKLCACPLPCVPHCIALCSSWTLSWMRRTRRSRSATAAPRQRLHSGRQAASSCACVDGAGAATCHQRVCAWSRCGSSCCASSVALPVISVCALGEVAAAVCCASGAALPRCFQG